MIWAKYCTSTKSCLILHSGYSYANRTYVFRNLDPSFLFIKLLYKNYIISLLELTVSNLNLYTCICVHITDKNENWLMEISETADMFNFSTMLWATYCMSTKSCLILQSEYSYEIGLGFLEAHHDLLNLSIEESYAYVLRENALVLHNQEVLAHFI